MATRCCWPPESCAGYLSACSVMPTRSSSSAARSLALSLPRPRTLIGPRVRFSRIVLCANRLKDWKTMPTSARSLASSLPSSGSETPSISIVPDSNVSSRLIVRQRVDLPEPEGPMMTTTSPSPIVRSMSLRTCSSPKCLLTLSNTTKGRCIAAGESAGLSSLGVSVTSTHTNRVARRPELWLVGPGPRRAHPDD